MIEFAGAEWIRYRKYYRKTDLRNFAVGCVVAFLLMLIQTICELYSMGPTSAVLKIIILRGMLSVLLLAAYLCLVKFADKTGAWLIIIPAAVILTTSANLLINVTRIFNYSDDMSYPFPLLNILYLLMFYYMLPIESHRLRLVVPSVFMVAGIIPLFYSIENSGILLMSVLIALLINTFGWFVSCRYYEQRRKIFQSFLQEETNHLLMERNVETERCLRKTEKELLEYQAEIKILSAQIKPHFLSNMIQAMSGLFQNHPEKAEALLERLSVYLRHATNVDVDNVPIFEELEAVSAFLDMQVARINGRLKYKIVNNCCAEDTVLFCIIQTVVENAVLHGMRDCKGDFFIEITVNHCPDGLEIVVKDNGMGIDPEKITGIFAEEQVRAVEIRRNIGLRNIDRRLKLTGSAGLKINSVVGEGTVVKFTLPR